MTTVTFNGQTLPKPTIVGPYSEWPRKTAARRAPAVSAFTVSGDLPVPAA